MYPCFYDEVKKVVPTDNLHLYSILSGALSQRKS